MLIGGVSFYYTSRLVSQHEAREVQQIDLYARTYEYLTKSDTLKYYEGVFKVLSSNVDVSQYEIL